MATVSKSEFARRRNVSPARVTQWIAAGQISGAALVGEGRGAQIVEELAVEQLRRTRDIDQAHSMNGLGTNLELGEAPPVVTDPAAPPLPIGNTVESQIAAQRLEELQRRNRRAAIEETQALGELVSAAAARAQAAREIRQVVTRFEGALGDLANAIAAEFKVTPRDVLHLLRGKFREIRRAGALEARERAEPMQERVGHELSDEA